MAATSTTGAITDITRPPVRAPATTGPTTGPTAGPTTGPTGGPTQGPKPPTVTVPGGGPTVTVPTLPPLPTPTILTQAEAVVRCLAKGLVDNPLDPNDAFDKCVAKLTGG